MVFVKFFVTSGIKGVGNGTIAKAFCLAGTPFNALMRESHALLGSVVKVYATVDINNAIWI